jgi:hypothetical protein
MRDIMSKKIEICSCFECPILMDTYPNAGCYCPEIQKTIPNIDIIDPDCDLEEY